MGAADYALQLRAIAAMSFAEMRWAVRARLPPSLVAYAVDDPLVEPAISGALAQAIPGARRLSFEDGGHSIQKTRARELSPAIRGLLAGSHSVSAPQKTGV
jgi:pimeloyl-ACP methyl ester carboxylesterase